ncbi:membrane dipeptidase [Alphaproteobacteria bacterium]|nr:membrane dipeptidase [Alphaproteobacteria bacterium]
MFVADLHNDLVQRIMIGEDVIQNTSSGHTDIERLKNSSIDLEVMIVWASEKESNVSYFEFASHMYEKLKALEDIEGVSVPISLEEIYLAKKNNQLSLPIAMEGGEALENKIENLEYFINKGLFYFGPTWNHSLDWVSSGYGETHKKSTLKNFGLNEFGSEVIHLCQENRVLVDVSHIGEKSFWDIITISEKPIIASHSSVHKLCSHFRNLKDDQIEAIKKTNGFIGLNPYPFFIDPTFKIREQKIRTAFKQELNELADKQKTTAGKWIAKQYFLQKKLSSVCPDMDIFIDHIEYIIKMIGIDYVGIGSDYDGLDCLPKGWNDCMDHMLVAEQLDKRGYKTNEIEKIMGKNILRVLEEIWS